MSDRLAQPLDPVQQRRHKLRNLMQSALLLGGMLGLLAISAWSIAGPDGVVWVVGGAIFALAFGPRVSPQWVLTMYGARPLPPEAVPEGARIVAVLARRAGLSRVPRLYYVPSPILNAFAVGNREQAVIAVTDGLLRTLTLRELAGVLAHEISHIRNNDLWIMSLADIISRLTMMMSYAGMMLLMVGLPVLLLGGTGLPWLLIVLLVFSPSVVNLLQLALSRAREFDADLDAAGLTGDPLGLASALRKLELYQGRLWERILLPGARIPDPSLLRTHPPTEERIRRLLELRPAAPHPDLDGGEPVPLPAGLTPVSRRPRLHLTGAWY
ncbi:MAG: peptidase M48 Ste24p [Alphaproteobacteria bacterium]|nr:MAG: peptidase M48 Ste24p [Alphaproteobacteria bacterium]